MMTTNAQLDDSSKTESAEQSLITYDNYDTCPLCGSSDYELLPEQKQVLQATPIRPTELQENAIVHFSPVICRHCGISYNIKGLSAQSRDRLFQNYHFIKPSSGAGAANYQSYIEVVKASLKRLSAEASEADGAAVKNKAVLEVGGYDGYLLRQLADDGYSDLTLVDPSPQVEPEAQERYHLKVCKDFFSKSWLQQHGLEGHFDVIATKDTIQMVPPLIGFVEGLVAGLREGGILVLSSVMHGMTAMQFSRLGKNACYYIAKRFGLKVLDWVQESETSYYSIVLQKPVAGEIVPEFAWSEADFAAELKRNEQQLAHAHDFAASDVAKLEQEVKKLLDAGEQVVMYGTGFAAFNMLDCLSNDIKEKLLNNEQNLLLVNSDASQDGYLFLLPNGKYHSVRFAGEALKDKEVSSIILAVLSSHFKSEIESYLKQIGCKCDHLVTMTA